MKINFNEYMKELEKCNGDKQDIVDLFVDNSEGLNKDTFKEIHLPENPSVVMLKERQIKYGFTPVPLQPTTIVKPETLKNLKFSPKITKQDAAILSLRKFQKENKGATTSEFKSMVESTIEGKEKSKELDPNLIKIAMESKGKIK